MSTIKEQNAKILAITMKIKSRYPELSKYIEEMRVTIPDPTADPVTENTLALYYSSLEAMLKKYIEEQSQISE